MCNNQHIITYYTNSSHPLPFMDFRLDMEYLVVITSVMTFEVQTFI